MPAREQTENQVILSADQESKTLIQTGKTEKREMPHQLSCSGMMEAAPGKAFSVSMPAGGFVRSTQLVPGMFVRKGQTLAMMEDPQYIQIQQDYLEKKIQLKKAELDFKRQKELNESKASSDKILQQAEMEYQSLLILVSALEEKLKLLHLNPALLSVSNISGSIALPSPSDGYITKVKARPGQYANPSDVLFELMDPKEALLRLKVFEKDIRLLKPGMKLTATPAQNEGQTFIGKILLINQEISEERTIDIYCKMDGSVENLMPGAYLNALIETEKINMIGVPESAVVRHAGKDYVFVSEGQGSYALTEVNTGRTTDGWTELIDGNFLADKEIVIQGAYALLMSLKNKSDE
jgi:cobalt-zinc-cadmium efflux system membrane fusion protein